MSRTPKLSCAALLAFGLCAPGCGSPDRTMMMTEDMAVPTDSSGMGTALALDDVYTVTPGEAFMVAAANGVLANDTAVAMLTAGARTSTQGADANVAADGSFTYATPVEMTGDDTFTYSVMGSDGVAVTGTVTLRPRVGCGDGTRQTGELCFPSDPLVTRGLVSRSTLANIDADSAPELVVTSVSQLGHAFVEVFEVAGPGLALRSTTPLSVFELSGEHALGDVDGDDDLDLLFATYDTLHIHRNDGTGTFNAWVSLPYGASVFGDVALTTGRFDADAHLDVAVLQRNDGTVQLLRGDGTGAFDVSATPILVTPSYRVQAVDIGDDGDLDIALLPQNASAGDLRFLRGDGIGGLVEESLTTGVSSPVVLDGLFDADAHRDLVVVGTGITLLPGDGAGDYGTAVDLTPVTAFTSVLGAALGDFDGDTRLDVAGASNGGLRVLFQTPAGGLSDGWSENPGVRYEELHRLPGAASAADDLLARNDRRVTRFRGDGAGGMVESTPALPSTRFGSFLTDGALADLDGDGALDLVVADYNTSRVSRFAGDGRGGFGAPAMVAQLSSAVQSVAIGRLDANTSADILTAETSGSSVGIWLATVSGGFSNSGSVAVGPGPARVVLADFDGDTILDFATANAGTAAGVPGGAQDTVSIRLGTGSGTFTAPAVPEVPACEGPERLAVGLVDDDTHLDLVVTCISGDEVAVLLGDGAGGFTHAAGSPIATGNARDVALADLDGDEVLDFVITQEVSQKLAVWKGVGDGTFTYLGEVPVGGVTHSLALLDLDGDEVVDLVATTDRGAELYVGVGDGTFTTPPGSRTGAFGGEVVAGDLTGDGLAELVLIDGPSVTVLRSRY
ncbi:MAG: FG-GAP-like repeat-containing protein [Polyangiales bacterium]|nr:VCBS repeat-containing protein [Myxococcales bacterium]